MEPTERTAYSFDQIGMERSQKQPTVASAAAHNPEVGGSNPPPATRKSTCFGKCFFQRNKSLTGFVKCLTGVKYGFAM